MPNHTIVNKEAIGGSQLSIVSTPVLAAATSITSFVSCIVWVPLFYLADNGPVVTKRNTVTQLAMMQPTIACPAAETGKKPT
jgi:hypothetical protein